MKDYKHFKSHFLLLIIIYVSVFLTGCGILTDKTARKMFLSENPSFKIVDSYTGEGWDGVGYHHFQYKKPDDNAIYNEVWCFVQQENGSWKVTERLRRKN